MSDGAQITPNDVVALFVELAAIAVLAVWGWRQGSSLATNVMFGVGLPVAAMVAWWLFAAPRSRFDVRALEVAAKAVVLGGAVGAGFAVLPLWLAVVFAVVVVVNTVLLYVGPWAR